MKLKCDKHNRRVLHIPGMSRFLHRTGDMSECNSVAAVMQDNRSHITRMFAIFSGELASVSTNKEQRPHTSRNKG